MPVACHKKTIVFVHIPKTAGSSLRHGILRAKPAHTILFDYRADSKATTKAYVERFSTPEGRGSIAAEFIQTPLFLCGHFRAKKYTPHFPLAHFATFFRNPVERVLSHFNHRLRRGFEITLDEFIETPDFQNLQAKYLEGVNWSQFGFIGLTENYKSSLKRFREFSGIQVKELKRNVQARKFAPPPSRVIARIEVLNEADMKLYESVKAYLSSQ